MSKKLVIVESPAKAKTIGQYLGTDFTVRASYGHVRDLPVKKLGIDPAKHFEVEYIPIVRAKKVLTELKTLLKTSAELYLATDFDREGEAIAWHLLQAMGLKENPNTKSQIPIHRITFHEITKPAIENALKHPRSIDAKLVDAQQARRILDRLVGYKLSPFLWKKVYRGLSAGRVQSVAVRLIVEREREIAEFKSVESWTLDAILKSKDGDFAAYLAKEGTTAKLELADAASIDALKKKLEKSKLAVEKIESTDSQLKPQAPLITSTLQQAAARVLHFSAKKTMKIAQDLYEGVEIEGKGSVALITYMRTDSYQMSDLAKKQAEALIAKNYGAKYLPDRPNMFSKKVRGAQEAHEAIRPTDFAIRPDEIKGQLTKDHYNLYNLIWSQATASLMAPSLVKTTTASIHSDAGILIGRGRELVFDGFMKLVPDVEENFVQLPKLAEKEAVTLKKLDSVQHFTEPPARYSEASLVRELEKRGIGRPSTYAPIMSTIVDRGYVTKLASRFTPTEVAGIVVDLLVEHFPDIIDYNFTAEMEDKLDDIAEGKRELEPVLEEFYTPFAKLLTEKEKSVDKKAIVEEATDKKCPDCGKSVVLKLGRYGKFYSCSGFPECKHTEPYLDDKFTADEEKEIKEEVKEMCEKCGGKMAIKQGRFGTFLACSNYPKCKFTKAIVIGSSVPCPNCGKELIRRNTRRGKVFWGCSGYPDCKTAYWDEPLAEKCPKCSNLMVNKKSGPACSQCDYKKEKEGEPTTGDAVEVTAKN